MTTLKQGRFHPVAGIFPMMAAAELEQLAEDIRANGQREPIWIHQGQIVDGRNRFLACRKAGVDPKYREYTGDDGGLVPFVLSLNLHRRHLNESQRAMVAAEIEAYLAEQAKKRQGTRTDLGAILPPSEKGKARDKAAELVRVSGRSVSDAKKVRAEGSPELGEAVRQGKIAVSVAAKLTDAPPETQRAIVEHVNRGAKPTEAVRQVKRETLTDRVAALPAGKHRVIYADPPWKYGDSREGLEDYSASAAEGHYPTMSVEELCALDVQSLAADDAVLFCWATFPLLPDALRVVAAWGFKYKTAIVWDKDRANLGNYHNAAAELLLICTRGSCTPDTGKRPDQVQTIKRVGRHSEKPEEFRQLVDAMYPHGPRIELFRRGSAPPGWTVWGNEAEAA
jgi:N6-adenosine-specific RNA methylase IME4/ParB-like chromosome segregation protein Spo0J